MLIKRGDIFYADLNPVFGSEQGGYRPVLVIQNDIGNHHSPTVIVVPISSVGKKAYLPVHINISDTNLLPKDSVILLEQIRTLDKKRLSEYVGSFDCEMMQKINRAIKISVGVDTDE